MACGGKKCREKRAQLMRAAKSGDVKETVKVAVEGIRIMVGLEAGQIKLLPTKKE